MPDHAPSPTSLHLSNDDLHVWQALLRQPDDTLSTVGATLSADERARAERMSSTEQQGRFVVARGVLRDILSRYLDVEPECIELAYEEHGKPRLGGDLARSGVSFNLSHAEDMALYAITLDRAVGIDVESVHRRFRDAAKMARRFFSPLEYDAFVALPKEQRPLAFLRCWTRKEAFIKAIGEGLTHPLRQFDVSFLPGEPPALLGTRPDAGEARNWRLCALEPAPDYVGAVVVAGQGCRLAQFRWAA